MKVLLVDRGFINGPQIGRLKRDYGIDTVIPIRSDMDILEDVQGHEELNRRTCPTTRRLLPDGDRVIVYRQQYFAFFTLLEHMEMTLSLEGKARRKALAKTRRLQHEAPGSPPDRPAGS